MVKSSLASRRDLEGDVKVSCATVLGGSSMVVRRIYTPTVLQLQTDKLLVGQLSAK